MFSQELNVYPSFPHSNTCNIQLVFIQEWCDDVNITPISSQPAPQPKPKKDEQKKRKRPKKGKPLKKLTKGISACSFSQLKTDQRFTF